MRPRLLLKNEYYLRLITHNPWLAWNRKSWNYLKYKLSSRRPAMDPSKIGPVYLSISVTRRCNLSCAFCVVGKSLNPRDWREYEATAAIIERLLSHPVAGKCLYVMLTGGEPLLNRDIVPIVRTIKSRKHLAGITSNGVLLADHVDDLRAARLDLLNVSLYDANRDALATILPRACEKLYCKITKVVCRADVQDPDRIEETLRFARETGCRRVYFQNVFAHDQNSGFHAITEEDESYPEIVESLTRRYADVCIQWPPAAPLPGSPGLKRCRMPWYLLAVNARGQLGFCCGDAVCRRPGVFDLPADQIMNTDEWNTCRTDLLSPNGKVPDKCAGCFELNGGWGANV